MVVAQRVKEAEITEQDSLLLTRNLLRIAIFNISYIRGLFPEKYFNDKSVPALEMKIKKLMPMDSESRRLIDWMEKGVYDALQKKYLKTLLFCICEDLAGPMIEEYAFSFSYTSSNSEEVSMNVNRVGNKKNGTTFKSNAAAEITPDMMRSSACKMVRTLVQLMRTLDQMPQERTILMKLLYFEDVTPEDYEPPFFRGCTGDEANATWAKKPLKMEVGNVNSKHLVLALKVKSILDPCEDENDNVPTDEEVSLGEGSMQEDDSSSSDTEVRPSLADQYFVAPAGSQNDNGTVSEAETEDLAHEEEQISRVKMWLKSRHTSTVDLTDILSNFPEISVALTEDIVEKLLKEGFISKAGKDNYTIIKEKDLSEKICDVKEEADMQESPCAEKTYKDGGEDYMYMKALYHALTMDYVTIGKLQSKLDGKVNQATVRKLIDKMTQDGYLKNSGSRKLGKRVIHSESSNKKLIEVKKALDPKLHTKPVDMEVETNVKPFEFNGADFPQNGYNARDGSTYGGLHSIGSDLTRTRGQSEVCPNRSVQSGQTAQLKAGEHGNTPMSRVEPIDSMESGIAGHGADISKSKITIEGDNARSTQDKRSRKASTVKDPILQYMKRQKSQAQ